LASQHEINIDYQLLDELRMAAIKIHFLAVDTPHHAKSKRQRELNRAEALSHAATVAHQRAGRGLYPKEDDEDENGATGTASLRRQAPQKSQRSSYRGRPLQQRRQREKQRSEASVVQIKTGPLDPFLQLPMDLGTKDRQLLHVCE
jgi:hypothetical protein